jgi:hypothetical protein
MDKLLGISFFLLVIILGAGLVIGAAQRWSWLVDPPEEYWFVYSQSFIKKFFGKRVLLFFTYAMGFLTITAGIYVLVKGIWM